LCVMSRSNERNFVEGGTRNEIRYESQTLCQEVVNLKNSMQDYLSSWLCDKASVYEKNFNFDCLPVHISTCFGLERIERQSSAFN